MNCKWLRRKTTIFRSEQTHRHVEEYDIMHGWSLRHDTKWKNSYEVKNVLMQLQDDNRMNDFTQRSGECLDMHSNQKTTVFMNRKELQKGSQSNVHESLRQQHECWNQCFLASPSDLQICTDFTTHVGVIFQGFCKGSMSQNYKNKYTLCMFSATSHLFDAPLEFLFGHNLSWPPEVFYMSPHPVHFVRCFWFSIDCIGRKSDTLDTQCRNNSKPYIRLRKWKFIVAAGGESATASFIDL